MFSEHRDHSTRYSDDWPIHPGDWRTGFSPTVCRSPDVQQVTILNPFLAKDFEEDKLVLAIDEHGRRLNIDIQTTLPAGMRQRLVYYASCLYVEQLTEGQAYAELLLATSICVLDAMVFPRIPICTWIFACVTANTAEF